MHLKQPAIQKSANTRNGQLPLKLRAGGKTDVRTQFAALCYRFEADKLKVCIVTSRRSKRWILPKGWPMHKETPADAAATEAWEEAGLTGRPIDRCLGVYAYVKTMSKSLAPVVVMVYPLEVHEEHDKWPERKQRKRKWLSPKKAAKRLAEPELRRIVAGFDPATLP
ncbi:NUDIX hydrolase [Yoonia sp. R2331]|uniref:NUDIX hydrolase n=1 Tax=Yoonia sp. R2331 TaxID=3237238 RepID=UPI0034E4B331